MENTQTPNIGKMIAETEGKVADVLNNSGLPASVLVLIVKDIFTQVNAVAQIEMNGNPQAKPQNKVELGEGIETPKEEDYDFTQNYCPQHAE